MVFSSIPFLYYFLPCVLLIYMAAPKKLKNAVLLFFSLFFYGWGEPIYVFLMGANILINYGLALFMEKTPSRAGKKALLILAVVLDIGCLGYFKYADFFIANFSRATGLSMKLLHVALPIGISFYTFQTLSYVVDVYRAHTKAQKNLIQLATYITLFPQLIAGPIVRYVDVEKELASRTHTFEKTAAGIRRFVLGLGKKVLLANTLGELCTSFWASDEKSVLFYWLFVLCYMLQIYFDFSGYSDMAIGLGKLFGFHFLENFDYPFISRSITEFWRRWHMSLGRWFRDYVYIPLGGNRVKMGRHIFNIFTVWFLTGFWHGAEWNFIVWGLYFGVLLTLEKLFFRKFLEKIGAFSHVYTLFFVAISFAIFSGDSLSQAMEVVGGMLGKGNLPLLSDAFLYALRNFGTLLILGAIAATPLPKILVRKLCENKWFHAVWEVLEIPLLIGVFLAATAFLADGAFNPFLYFRF